jgi:hypothetical protein
MSAPVSLKDAERKAFRSVFQDGLWDIYLGLLLSTMGFGFLIASGSRSELTGTLAVLGLGCLFALAFWSGKRYVTVPRLGLVKFGPKRKAKVRNVRVVLFLSALVGMVVFFFGLSPGPTGVPDWAANIPLVAYVWVAQVIVVFGIGAYFLDIPRFYIYGVLYAIPFPAAIALDENRIFANSKVAFPLTFGASAGIMVLVGLMLFARFLSDYPLPAEPKLEELRDGNG